MKNTTIAFIVICGLVFFSRVFAFDNFTTHPALTERSLEVYNSQAQTPLTQDEKKWVVEGSILEDTWPRWINHFYDPVNKIGWTGSDAGGWTAVLASIAPGSVAPDSPVAAPDWIKNPIVQQEYKTYGGVRTWQKALEYYANGNKEEAYKTLGYVLHIMEDMGVPDHTRNDTHIDGSPFEGFSTQWNSNHLPALPNGEITKFTEPETYLIKTAEYSNRYFLSPDTVNIYANPKILSIENGIGYGVDESNNMLPLVRVSKEKDYKKDSVALYDLSNNEYNKIIFDSYFAHLAPKIILNGAGLIDLFKKKTEEAVVNKEFPTRLVKVDESFLLPGFSILGEVYRLGNGISSTFAKVYSFFGGAKIETQDNKIESIVSQAVSHDTTLDDKIYFSYRSSLQPRVVSNDIPVSNAAPISLVDEYVKRVPTPSAPQKIAYVNRAYSVASIVNTQVSTAPIENTSTSPGDDEKNPIIDATSSMPVSTSTEPSSTISNDISLQGAYDPLDGRINLNWENQNDNMMTVSVMNSSGTWDVLFSANSLNLYGYYPRESGKVYKFKAESEDSNGSIKTGYTEVDAQSPATIAFYKKSINGAERYVIDMTLSSTSSFWSNRGVWDLRLIQFYLNEDPIQKYGLDSLREGGPSNISINQSRCSGYSGFYKDIIIPLPMGWCFYGGPPSSAYANYEENRLILETDIDPQLVLTDKDFIQAVFYKFGGWSSPYVLSDVDVNKHYFGNPIEQNSPSIPEVKSSDFDRLTSKLSVIIGTSTDPDSIDGSLRYEISISTSSNRDVYEWKSIAGQPTSFRVMWPEKYYIGARAVDLFGNYSAPSFFEWNFPSDFVPVPGQYDYSSKVGGDKGAQSFYIDKSVNVDGLTLRLGSEYPYWQYNNLQILIDKDGAPGDVFAVSEEMGFPSSFGDNFYTYKFRSPITLESNTHYWFRIVQRDPYDGDKMWLWGSTGDSYSGGIWSQGGDVYFEFKRI